MINPPIIRVDQLNLRYKQSAEYSLKDVNLTVFKNDIFGLLGPNGAGKTSLISILCGVFGPSSGEVHYLDNNQKLNPSQVQKTIGFVPQEYAFYQELTPSQNLAYFGAMYGLTRSEIKSRTQEILAILGLEKVSNDIIGTFSGGMKRRVNLAIGIIHQPSVLFLDEPTVGVDVQSKNAIVRYLKRLSQLGTTIIYTSHHLAEAEEICNRIALMDHGKVIAEDTLEKLLATYEKPNLSSLFIELTGDAYRD